MDRELDKQWKQLATEACYNARRLATLRRVTPRQLQRIFRHEFGRTPQDWLNEQRILAAQELLRAGDPVKRIAFDLGFKQISHFCRKFKTISGVTPNQFRISTGSLAGCRQGITNVANG